MANLLTWHVEQLNARCAAMKKPLTQGHWLLAGSGFLTATALLLWATGGYHAGFRTVNNLAGLVSPTLLEILTFGGDTLTALAVTLLFARRYPQILWLMILGALIATGLVQLPKRQFSVERPAAVLSASSLVLIGPSHRMGSFPSGHTATAFVVAGTFACYAAPWIRGVLMATAGLIGASRVAVGVHWPVDVLAGGALGLLSVWLALLLAQRWQWGLRLLGHHLLVALLLGCALASLLRTVPYPAAAPLARLLTLVAIGLVMRDYLLRPMLAARAIRRRPT